MAGHIPGSLGMPRAPGTTRQTESTAGPSTQTSSSVHHMIALDLQGARERESHHMKLSTTGARMLTVAGVGIGAVALIGGTATAASLITAKQMATGSVNSRVIKDAGIHQSDLTKRERDRLNAATFRGAVYRVENYKNGRGGGA